LQSKLAARPTPFICSLKSADNRRGLVQHRGRSTLQIPCHLHLRAACLLNPRGYRQVSC
jgi:hypothetical protein